MTDTQAMIREVCEALGRKEIIWDDIGKQCVHDSRMTVFRPNTDYNDTHLLINWMVEAGWQWEYSTYSGMAAFWKDDSKEMACEYDPDFRIAVLTAAWRAR